MFDDEFNSPKLNLADLKHDYTLADTQYEIIMEQISEFEKNLDDEHEVALKLCNFGQSILS